MLFKSYSQNCIRVNNEGMKLHKLNAYAYADNSSVQYYSVYCCQDTIIGFIFPWACFTHGLWISLICIEKNGNNLSKIFLVHLTFSLDKAVLHICMHFLQTFQTSNSTVQLTCKPCGVIFGVVLTVCISGFDQISQMCLQTVKKCDNFLTVCKHLMLYRN